MLEIQEGFHQKASCLCTCFLCLGLKPLWLTVLESLLAGLVIQALLHLQQYQLVPSALSGKNEAMYKGKS